MNKRFGLLCSAAMLPLLVFACSTADDGIDVLDPSEKIPDGEDASSSVNHDAASPSHDGDSESRVDGGSESTIPDADLDASNLDATTDAHAEDAAVDGAVPVDAGSDGAVDAGPDANDPVVDVDCVDKALGTSCSSNGGEICDGLGVCTVGFAVVRVGDGASSLDKYSVPVFVDRFTLTGVTLKASLPLPTAVDGDHRPLTLEGKRDDEGSLSLSGNGKYLLLAGYGVAPNVKDVHEKSASDAPRVVARIDGQDVIDTTTVLEGAFSKKSVRGATSSDGLHVWASGEGKDNTGGLYFREFGSPTPALRIFSQLSSTNVVHVFGDQLYASVDEKTYAGVLQIGVGLPTTAGQSGTSLPGLPTAKDNATHSFALLDLDPAVPGVDTLYFANEDSKRIEKWSLVGGTWVSSFNVGTSKEPRGLAARKMGSDVVLVVTLESESGGNAVLSYVDDGVNTPTPTTLQTAAAKTAYRGVSWLPR